MTLQNSKISQKKKQNNNKYRNKSQQAAFTAAGLAGGVTPVTGLRPSVFIVAWRASLQALSPLAQVYITVTAAQTVSVTTTPTLATRRVTVIASHGGGVAEITGKQNAYLFSFPCSFMNESRD